MQVHVRTDNNIEGSARMAAYFTETIQAALDRFAERITRVDVSLSDENAHKEGSNDKRCLLEARVNGLSPVVVTNLGENIDVAFSGALDKLEKSLETAIEKQRSY
jgi:ribosomal subunit interface protein